MILRPSMIIIIVNLFPGTFKEDWQVYICSNVYLSILIAKLLSLIWEGNYKCTCLLMGPKSVFYAATHNGRMLAKDFG